MADPESFLGRWSRLKREAEPPLAEHAAPEDTPPPEAVPPEPEREPLPPVESLGADSDYTRFLAPGVPVELTRLALRKAWVSDPKIAGFRGFAEYDWDCNAPGYGQLRATDNVRELLDAVFGDTPPEPPEAVPVADAEPAGTAAEDPTSEQPGKGGETSGA
ncbi:DUF3306 domain-containing protein [Azospirillum sp. sgz301742]